LWSRYQLWPEGWLRQQLILNWVQAHQENRRSIDAKLRYLRLTQVTLGFETRLRDLLPRRYRHRPTVHRVTADTMKHSNV
jgi:hypothetical protein